MSFILFNLSFFYYLHLEGCCFFSCLFFAYFLFCLDLFSPVFFLWSVKQTLSWKLEDMVASFQESHCSDFLWVLSSQMVVIWFLWSASFVYSGTSITRTPLVPSKVSRVRRATTLGASGIFPVMCTHAIECYEGTFQSSPLLYAGKKSQPDARIMHTSAIIMSSCWISQWYQTIMCERHASIRIIQWILYSPGMI